MPSFSSRSKGHLDSCHPDLQKLFERVIQIVDCTIIEGHRSEERQNEYFRTGRSKLQFPQSKHNQSPSHAVDVVPYPIDWNNTRRFDHFAGVVRGIAEEMGIKLRWGGDWDKDYDPTDQTFNDLPHFELVDAS